MFVRRILTAHACFVAACCLHGALAWGQQRADVAFKPTVDQPAYSEGNHPRVLFDEAHFNVHTTRGTYQAFTALITSDGYQVEVNNKPFDSQTLAGHDLLVISNARGAAQRPEKPAFTDEECDAVRDWVRDGGALLLVVDHYPTGHAAEMLAKRFGVDLGKGTTSDRSNSPPGARGGVMLFTRDAKQLGDHAIMRGRGDDERIDRVATFTGQSLKGPEGSTPLLILSDTAIDLLLSDAASTSDGAARAPARRGKARRTAGANSAQAAPQVSAAGRSQGVAFEFGKGRVVVLGEASQLSAQRAGPQQFAMGMNYPDCDNRQWALNIMHWLSRLID